MGIWQGELINFLSVMSNRVHGHGAKIREKIGEEIDDTKPQVLNWFRYSIGADTHASIFRVQAKDQKNYFVKLKRDHLQAANLAILELLHNAGIKQIIPPLRTSFGKQIHQ